MTFIKKIPLHWSSYFLQTFFCLYFLLAPLFLNYIFDLTNPNNTTYTSSIITKHFIKTAVIIISFSYVICSPFLFIKKRLYNRLFSIPLVLIYSSALLDFIHVLIYSERANSPSYYSIFASNTNETLEFISDYSSTKVVLASCLLIIIPCLIYSLHKRIKDDVAKKMVAALFAILFIVSSIIGVSRSEILMCQEISIIKLVQTYSNYKAEIASLNQMTKKQPILSMRSKDIVGPETYIFVIGESTSKHHMQLYGYHRETSPELTKLKNELLVFNNVQSDHVHTVESLKSLLLLHDKNGQHTNNSIIDCFNNAGYSTYWLSNQSFLGENETPISAIAKRTSRQIYINASGAKKLDEEILPQLNQILNEKEDKKVVFIHLMGTHLSYRDRYPAAFNVFSEKNISVYGDHADSYINQYDNAVLYNDYVVSEIIKKAKNITGNVAVTYLSDHGDEVYDFRNFHGHSGAKKSKYMTEIPLIIWGNEKFNQYNDSILKNLKQNISSTLYLKNFSHTIQELYDVKSKYYKPKKSYSRAALTSLNENEVKTKIPGQKEPYKFDSKIWAHRVNSIERLKEIEPLFKGMELDVVFENGKLDVRHPPVSSINLSLDKFLSNIKDPSSHYYWLDLKNATNNNIQEVLSRLDFIVKKYQLSTNFIVETTNPDIISFLNHSGHYSSYYLPDLAGLNAKELNNELTLINGHISMNEPTAISQNIGNYYIMKDAFPNQQKLIWALELDWNDPKNHLRIENLLEEDPAIKVCLVNYTTKGWR